MAAPETTQPTSEPRPGTTADVARRMDRIEQRQDTLETRVGELTATVQRVEQTLAHADEIHRLRFDAIDHGVKTLDHRLAEFSKRFESILSGETQTASTRALLDEYHTFRRETAEFVKRTEVRLASLYTPEQKALIEARLDAHDEFMAQGKLLGRLGVILITTNIVGIIVAVAAAANAVAHP